MKSPHRIVKSFGANHGKSRDPLLFVYSIEIIIKLKKRKNMEN